jgi:5-(carboxyamino)imidazole ribonucleotide mutase
VRKKLRVLVIMGSASDWPTMKAAVRRLREFGVEHQVAVKSAHRTPEDVVKIAKRARPNRFGAIIAAAGGAAHLAGLAAANTTLPVIGVPVKSKNLRGLDSLLSTVQMPAGIPVATVAIASADNAALLAIQILAVRDRVLAKKLEEHRKEMVAMVRRDSRRVARLARGNLDG